MSRLPISRKRPPVARVEMPAAIASPASELRTRSTPLPPVIARTSFGKCQRAGIHDMLHPLRSEEVALLHASRSRKNLRACEPRQLQRREADAAGRRLNQHTVTLFHPAEVMQRIPRGEKCNRDGGGFAKANPRGLSQDERRGHRAMGGETAGNNCHDRIADAEMFHLAPDRRD